MCLDDQMTTEKKAVKLFKDSVAVGVKIIALICPGYVFPKGPGGNPDYTYRWPKNMPEMRTHAHSINMRKMNGWDIKAKTQVLPCIQRVAR